MNYVPIDQHWEAKTNVKLLGDAAHLMTPSGEGVNTSMLDSLDLSECLTSDEHTDLQAAIGAYEQRMQARAGILGKEALDGIKDFSSPTEESIKKLMEMFGANADHTSS